MLTPMKDNKEIKYFFEFLVALMYFFEKENARNEKLYKCEPKK